MTPPSGRDVVWMAARLQEASSLAAGVPPSLPGAALRDQHVQ